MDASPVTLFVLFRMFCIENDAPSLFYLQREPTRMTTVFKYGA
jgi:hypothetical protein